MRVVDPAGWPWTVHRRWLPWRPRIHRAVADFWSGVDASDELNFVIGLLLSLPSVLLLPFLLIEWTLLAALFPFAVLARLCGRPWVVAARGRADDGTLVRYEARAARWGSRSLRDRAAASVARAGVPGCLGDPVSVRVAADDAAGLLRERLNSGAEITVTCLVQGFGTGKSRDGWIEGQLTAIPGLLTFRPGGLLSVTWPLLGSDDAHLALAGPADRPAVGRRVVASYPTPFGQYRVAADPHLGPVLRDLLAAGAEPIPGDLFWTMWRQDDAGSVREIARFGCRADAELLAENLAARGSRQRFWLAAGPR